MKKILLIGASLLVSAFTFAPQSQATQWCFYGNDASPSTSPATLNCANTGAGNIDTQLSQKDYKSTDLSYTVTVIGGFDSTLTNGLANATTDSVNRSLMENNRGTGEVGLGLQGGYQNELDNQNGSEFLLIDLGFNYAQFANWQIEFSSVDQSGNTGAGEGALVFTAANIGDFSFDLTSSTALNDSTKTLLNKTVGVGTGFSNGFYSLTNVQRFLLVFENFNTGDGTGANSNDDILVASLKADKVPEPALGFMLGGSLMALGLLRRKQK